MACSECIHCVDISMISSQCMNKDSKFYLEYYDSGSIPLNNGCDKYEKSNCVTYEFDVKAFNSK